MKLFFALLALATVVAGLLSGSAENRTGTLQERGGSKFGDFFFKVMGDLSSVSGSRNYVQEHYGQRYDYFTPCEIYFPGGYAYNLTDTFPGGLRGLACWDDRQHLVTWDEQTAVTAACLAYLHVQQGTKCISSKDSACDMGYVATGGILKNLRQTGGGKGNSSKNKISFEEYLVLEAAINILINKQVNSVENGPYFIVVKSDGVTRASKKGLALGSRTDFQANFVHGQSC